ncbi:2Fe-2S iron-sulfur cluster-binding protein [Moraxella oculi]|uniref:2Fe-2S iron-sulfur cluster-binding protein n=1 Tax=Moraxella oculi TaxID=2940516 RepID=A0ABW8U6V8_9GAMM
MGWVFTDEMRFYLHDGETLLQGMRRTQHQMVRFECQEGYCGCCKMRVTAKTGVVNMVRTPIAILEDDEILACCCCPVGTVCVTYVPKATDQHDDANLASWINLMNVSNNHT